VPPRVDKETVNSFFTERFGGFQPMQAFNEHEPSAVRPHQDRRLLALVEHARGDFVYALLIKGGTPLDWHVDVCDREGLALHHRVFTSSIGGAFLALLLSDAPAWRPFEISSPRPFRDDKRAVQSAEQISSKIGGPEFI
jgi:membrane-bound metal-dependent hydrolase YbcI (DUF457 family)